MLGDDVLEIHSIELVAGEDEEKVVVLGMEMEEVLADGVGGALVPIPSGFLLFGGKDVDITTAEAVEFVGALDVLVEGGGVKLGQEVDLVDAGIETVGNGDVDQAVFAAKRDGGLATEFGEGGEACPAAASHDDGNDSFFHG